MRRLIVLFLPLCTAEKEKSESENSKTNQHEVFKSILEKAQRIGIILACFDIF